MNKKDVQLSKSLSWLLRHGAIKEGLALSSEGYVAVEEILQHKIFKGKYVKADIERVVNNNEKKRFKLHWNTEQNILEIKAHQGHTIREVDDTDLIPIVKPIYKTIVHGTYYSCWPKIKIEGLSRMKRRHIHLSKGVLGSKVISGLRNNVQIYIFINLEKALTDGIKFYESENGVILTAGNEQGFLRPDYFEKVVDIRTGFPYYAQPHDIQSVFSEYGKFTLDKVTAKFANLTFSKEEDAEAALRDSDKLVLYGEFLTVSPLQGNQPKEETQPNPENNSKPSNSRHTNRRNRRYGRNKKSKIGSTRFVSVLKQEAGKWTIV